MNENAPALVLWDASSRRYLAWNEDGRLLMRSIENFVTYADLAHLLQSHGYAIVPPNSAVALAIREKLREKVSKNWTRL